MGGRCSGRVWLDLVAAILARRTGCRLDTLAAARAPRLIVTFLHKWIDRFAGLRIARFLAPPNLAFQLTRLIEKRPSRSTPPHSNAVPPVTSIPCLDSSSFQRNTSLPEDTAASRDADTVLT